MGDSLREQLLKAGFEAPAEAPRGKTSRRKRSGGAGRHHGGASSRSSADRGRDRATPAASDDAAIAKRRETKRAIRALVEANRVKAAAGEEVYRYQQGSRIREIRVTPEVRAGILAGEYAITRLDGSTVVIPIGLREAIRALNPDWAIIAVDEVAPEHSGQDDGDDPYADYRVPDDLQW